MSSVVVATRRTAGLLARRSAALGRHPGGIRAATSPLPSALVAAAMAVVAARLGWRGADSPNHLFRIDLFRRAGFTVWSSAWYGGHHTPAYSVLLPPLGALLGPALLGGASAVLAAACFDRLLRRAADRLPLHPAPLGLTLGSLLFAAGTVTNLAVGRLAFALGLALGLAALLAGCRRWPWAAGLSIATALASPVAGGFLLLAWAALAIGHRSRPAVLLGAVTGVPVVAARARVPRGGRLPVPVAGPAGDAAGQRGRPGAPAAVGPSAARRCRPVRRRRAGRLRGAQPSGRERHPPGGVRPRSVARRLRPAALGCSPPSSRHCSGGSGRQPSTACSEVAATPLPSLPTTSPCSTSSRPSRRPSPGSRSPSPVVTSRPPTSLPRCRWPRGWERQLDMKVNALFYVPGALDSPRATARGCGTQASSTWPCPTGRSIRPPRPRPGCCARASRTSSRCGETGGGGSGACSTARASSMARRGWWRSRPTRSRSTPRAAGTVLIRVRWTALWSVDGPACARPSADGWVLLDVQRPGRLVLHPVLLGSARTAPRDVGARERRVVETGAMRAVLLVLDAMPVRGIDPATTPVLAGLASSGGWAPQGGRAVLTSATYPNHATFVTGTDVDGHGLYANHVVRDGRVRRAWDVGPSAPTLFDACRDAGRHSMAVFGDHHLIGVMGAWSRRVGTGPATARSPEAGVWTTTATCTMRRRSSSCAPPRRRTSTSWWPSSTARHRGPRPRTGQRRGGGHVRGDRRSSGRARRPRCGRAGTRRSSPS